jgi:uncharacterized membrane protein YjgN (DUF898 family)
MNGLKEEIKSQYHKLKGDQTGYAAMIGGVIAILVSIVIGILVYYQIAGSIQGMPAAGVTAAANVNTTANTVFTLAPIIAIVLIASIILGVVSNFGRAQA